MTAWIVAALVEMLAAGVFAMLWLDAKRSAAFWKQTWLDECAFRDSLDNQRWEQQRKSYQQRVHDFYRDRNKDMN